MKNKSPRKIQLSVVQNKRPFVESKPCTIQVNSWVNTALTKVPTNTSKSSPSQMVEVHFAFSKSIMNRR
ncbi:MAG: hypothetical protein AB8E82_09145 [Aureispira sp.]